MPTVIKAELHEFHHWKFRFRPATAAPARLLVLLHGWTGDENSMWGFARRLPPQVAVLAPRGLHLTPEGGYSWREVLSGKWGLPVMEDFRRSADEMIDFIDDWSRSEGISSTQIDLIGFSQGAAFSFSLALLHPERIRALASLSGFLPGGAEDLLAGHPLKGKSVYIAHGRQDTLIPVEEARRSAALLKGSGAQVTYCESDGGHKVSVDCFSGLTDIFR